MSLDSTPPTFELGLGSSQPRITFFRYSISLPITPHIISPSTLVITRSHPPHPHLLLIIPPCSSRLLILIVSSPCRFLHPCLPSHASTLHKSVATSQTIHRPLQPLSLQLHISILGFKTLHFNHFSIYIYNFQTNKKNYILKQYI